MTFDEFVEKMLHDPEFRHDVIRDPEGALRERGLKPTEAQIEALKSVDFTRIEMVAKAFGSREVT
jgi:hypothetical protein